MYRRVEIEYSKFGVEDFDFGFVVFQHIKVQLMYDRTAQLLQQDRLQRPRDTYSQFLHESYTSGHAL